MCLSDVAAQNDHAPGRVASPRENVYPSGTVYAQRQCSRPQLVYFCVVRKNDLLSSYCDREGYLYDGYFPTAVDHHHLRIRHRVHLLEITGGNHTTEFDDFFKDKMGVEKGINNLRPFLRSRKLSLPQPRLDENVAVNYRSKRNDAKEALRRSTPSSSLSFNSSSISLGCTGHVSLSG